MSWTTQLLNINEIQGKLNLDLLIEDIYLLKYPNNTHNIKLILENGDSLLLHKSDLDTNTYKELADYLFENNLIIKNEITEFETPFNNIELLNYKNTRLSKWFIEIYKESVLIVNDVFKVSEDVTSYKYQYLENFEIKTTDNSILIVFNFYDTEEMVFTTKKTYLLNTSFEEAKKLVLNNYKKELIDSLQ